MAARPDDAAGADDTSPAEGAAPGGGAPAAGRGAGDGGDDGAPAAGPPATGDDAVWAAIVARLQDVDLAADAESPSSGRVVRPAASDPARTPEAADDQPAARLSGRDWDGTSQYDAAEDVVDEAEHFVPPDPGPVLGGEPLLTMAWSAAVGVPLFLLVVVVGWRDAPVLLVRAAVVLFVVAVGVLVWRMPHRRDPSDDDPGAVV
ncbi:hypothetical protein [Cellulomonas shaoxiangyii]|uniref:Uncharacterized protein n=1 Tax=Cellulomonas shaoxiangyii TaxID=2566013 RepID=A0A4P7SGV1_9CELL|nr:hypothetical protein [Cellulomonas shaoxiangyii]QCB93409.1 hypothetical protein E5225_07415 [Cellulomonas shaoxiangyii]TGY84646.1 hypothetical protein E5226_10240 [Cellulomonas shaoxiangyii]